MGDRRQGRKVFAIVEDGDGRRLADGGIVGTFQRA